MAINQKIPIVPIVFLDNKKRFPFTFFSGGPGISRVKILAFAETHKIDNGQITILNNNIRGAIYKELLSEKNTNDT